ncbi:hypothetical protein CWI75_10740 [Kineobactrum sediminis]|uniref:Uncharacterized protein n=1 Tax=Kineobactrum sediminis TaxID=1905677 RepID=A0A2N5Y1H4_9GAMM|nr:hypothetical protein [Kineobactrum sediminis]PLW82247.1 hypothetical protein CWI75_10740 [Kineobactrum sediminis]
MRIATNPTTAQQDAQRPAGGHRSFADGSLPLSAEAIQSEIRRVRRQADDQLHQSMLGKQKLFDEFALNECADLRKLGHLIPADILQAEAEALARMNDAAVIDLCRAIRSAGERLATSHQSRFRAALVRLSSTQPGG